MDIAAHTLTTGGPPRVGDFQLGLRDLGLLLGFAAATLLADRVLLTLEGR